MLRSFLRPVMRAFRRTLLNATPSASKTATSPDKGNSRSAYKSVWNNLSDTEDRAKMHVSGYVEEEKYLTAANETRKILEETVGIKPEDEVLEIGCGVGRVGMVLAPICKRWTGCDVSGNMLSHAAKRLSKFKNVRLIEISGFDLKPIADASVDVVYCTVVFMHLEEWDRYNYILEAYRVLRPGGRVYMDNFSLCAEEGWSVFETHRRIAATERPPHISKSSTPQEIETYLNRAGFKSVRVEQSKLWVYGWGIK